MRKKERIVLQARKFKLIQFSLEELVGAGLRLYAKDCELHVKDFGSGDPYRIERPFGDIHAEPGASI